VAAKERQQATLKRGDTDPVRENFADGGRSTDKIGKFAGVSGRTIDKIATVMEAAKAEPEKFGELPEMMDEKSVNAAYRKLNKLQDEERILAIAPIVGKFPTLIIDPPGDYGTLSLAGRAAPHYETMTQEQLLAFDIGRWISPEHCHLYLWTTNNFMLHAGALMEAWGFHHKTVLTWVKPKIGLGSYFRSATEHVLFGIRGNVSTRRDDIPTYFEAPTTGEYSAKPEEFYDIVRAASYPPYGEIFQREARADFTSVFKSKAPA
jgi:N6-adenosine-specific RNA methylase IME4